MAEFWNKRERLFGELEVKNIHVSNSEKKFSLLRGLKSDRCFRESIEPYFTQVKKLPGSYEDFKDEVLRWKIGEDQWNYGEIDALTVCIRKEETLAEFINEV